MRVRNLLVCRFLQLLQTIHWKLFKDSGTLEQTHQKQCPVYVDTQMQKKIPRAKAAYVRGFDLMPFWSDQAIFHRDGLFRLCECWRAVTIGGWRFITSSSLFSKKNHARRVLLRDIWQRTFYHNLLFWRIKARTQGHQSASECPHQSQKLQVFYDHKKIDTEIGKMDQIFVRVQLCHQLPEQQEE